MENKRIAMGLDEALGGILCNIESLKAIDTEVSHMREDVDNTDQSDITAMGMRFRDINHKIVMIDDLLRYTLREVIENYEECQLIKTEMMVEVKHDED